MHTHVCTHAHTARDSAAVVLNAHVHFLKWNVLCHTMTLESFSSPLCSPYSFQRLTEPISDICRNKGPGLTSAHSLKSWCAQGLPVLSTLRRACSCQSVQVPASILLGKLLTVTEPAICVPGLVGHKATQNPDTFPASSEAITGGILHPLLQLRGRHYR